MRRVALALTVLVTPAWLFAQNSVPSPNPSTAATTGTKPGKVALVLGGALLFSGLMDNAVQEDFQEFRNPATNGMARVGNAFGNGKYVYPAMLATWVAGSALGSEGVRRASGHALVAATAAGLATTALKWTIGRERPSTGFDSDHFDGLEFKDSSFPSGHTAVAFSIATSLSRDIKGPWDDVALYGAASLTGLARMNDNKHWLSDVVAGAAVGIFAGKWATRNNSRLTTSGLGFTYHF